MKILVACEESQAVTIEMRRLGHEAYSCDIEPCSGGHPEWHIMQDVIPLINGQCKFKTMDGKEHEITSKWDFVPFPVSWTVKMKKKQKETQDILSYHSQAAGCSDKARAKASGGRQPIEECGRTGL